MGQSPVLISSLNFCCFISCPLSLVHLPWTTTRSPALPPPWPCEHWRLLSALPAKLSMLQAKKLSSVSPSSHEKFVVFAVSEGPKLDAVQLDPVYQVLSRGDKLFPPSTGLASHNRAQDAVAHLCCQGTLLTQFTAHQTWCKRFVHHQHWSLHLSSLNFMRFLLTPSSSLFRSLWMTALPSSISPGSQSRLMLYTDSMGGHHVSFSRSLVKVLNRICPHTDL